MKRLLTVLAAAVMLVLAIGCSDNNAEVEQLRKELDEIKAATPIGATTPTPTPAPATAQADSRNVSQAQSLVNRGYEHDQQGDWAAAITDYTSVVESYSAEANPAIREWVAKALRGRGYAHGRQGDWAAALADYTLVVESYSADADPRIRDWVAQSLVNRGYAHGRQGDWAAAITDYTSVVESYSSDADPAIRDWVAKALSNRGYAHHLQGNYAAAIADFTSVVESYSADADPALRAFVADSLSVLTSTPSPTVTPTTVATKTLPPTPIAAACRIEDSAKIVVDASVMVITDRGNGTAFHMGDGVFVTAAHVVSGGGRVVLNNDLIQVEASITLIDERADIAELRAPSAAVLPSLDWSPRETITPGLTVATVGYPMNVIGMGSLSRGVVSRLFTESGLHHIQTDVSVNSGNSGGALVDECGDVLGVVVSKLSGGSVEGISYAIEARSVRDSLNQTIASTRLEAAQTLHNRGGTHFAQGNYAAAIADFTLVVERYSNDIDPAMREQVAESLVTRGIAHYVQGDLTAEIADYTLVVNSYSTDASPTIRKQVANAFYYRGLTHHEKGDLAAAIADYTSVVNSYSTDADPAIREWVANAREQLAKLAD